MAKNKEKKAGKRMKKKELIAALMDFFHSKPDEVLSLKYIFEQLHLTTHPLKMLCRDILSDLLLDDYITEVDKSKYKLNNHGVEMVGTFQRKSNGKNSFIPEGGGDPIFVAERNSAHAMNNDKVRISFYAKRRGREAEGEVIEILERANDTFVGTLEVGSSYAFLVTENRTLANDIFIPKEKLKGGKTGDKAIVKVVEWPDKAKNPIGQVIDILGKAGDNTTEMHAILAEFGLPYVYPSSVEKAADRIPAEISAEEIAKREDFRNVTTFTIDPKDAKDFDDALSIRKIKDGLWEVGVHIADVTHYVREHSPLDEEALKRGTSVYLTDRVIPMLPHKLSNGICSLNQGEDRLALSCLMDIDEKGTVTGHEIVETVIRVDRRMTYTAVNAVITEHDPEAMKEYEGFTGMFELMKELADILRKKRHSRGSIDFDFPESKIVLDEKGRPVEIKPYDRNAATRLIEDFMLLANETVAEDYFWQEIPFLYRTHDNPDEEKMKKLGTFINNFGYTIRMPGGEVHPKELQKLLDKVEGTPEEALISRLTLRSMKQAKYTTQNSGHFGLATKYYTHFTSPIRRYPDLQIHRIIKECLNGKMDGKRVSHYEKILPEVSVKTSALERRADEAERETDKMKKVQYMEQFIGEEFEGVISGVTNWGFYVELPNTVEGLVHIHELRDDYYLFDELHYELIGEMTRRTYKLGQPIRVQVTGCDRFAKTIDFIPAGNINTAR